MCHFNTYRWQTDLAHKLSAQNFNNNPNKTKQKLTHNFKAEHHGKRPEDSGT